MRDDPMGWVRAWVAAIYTCRRVYIPQELRVSARASERESDMQAKLSGFFRGAYE